MTPFQFKPRNFEERLYWQRALGNFFGVSVPTRRGLLIETATEKTARKIAIKSFSHVYFDLKQTATVFKGRKRCSLFLNRAQNCLVLAVDDDDPHPQVMIRGGKSTVYAVILDPVLPPPAYPSLCFDYVIGENAIVMRWPVPLYEGRVRNTVVDKASLESQWAFGKELETTHPQLNANAPPHAFFVPTVSLEKAWRPQKQYYLYNVERGQILREHIPLPIRNLANKAP